MHIFQRTYYQLAGRICHNFASLILDDGLKRNNETEGILRTIFLWHKPSQQTCLIQWEGKRTDFLPWFSYMSQALRRLLVGMVAEISRFAFSNLTIILATIFIVNNCNAIKKFNRLAIKNIILCDDFFFSHFSMKQSTISFR